MNAMLLQSQLDQNRRSVSFDSYDLSVKQLVDMIADDNIDIAPEYQRHFVWDAERQSQLIESILLGIPVPSVFMATNSDSTWEVIDGLQRITTIINFCGDEDLIKKVNPKSVKLKISTLEKLSEMNGCTFEELPKPMQLMFTTRPIRVTVLNDRSDFATRYDLFERLNTGGVSLHPQEIRNCIYRGKFNDFLKEMAASANFRKVVKVSKNSEKAGNYEELALKFFAYYQRRQDFVHSVKQFLNDYMSEKTEKFKDENALQKIFDQTFSLLSDSLPNGIVRGTRVNSTPLILFEAIAVGVAESLPIGADVLSNRLPIILEDEVLKDLTTGATNSRVKLNSRIDFVKDALR